MPTRDTDGASARDDSDGASARDDSDDLPDSEEEWRERLSDQEYHVLRERGTEPRGTGDLLHVDDEGTFRCAGCGTALFSTDEKFASSTGWPSFWDVVAEANVVTEQDTRHGMNRVEVLCGTCDGHLGHVFDDGPEPTGKRYCINSVALEFDSGE